uniref:Polyprotein n=1 Tax=Panagrolaimus sp. ES5 TaxID=591445 RepID=A0AC34G473_9BILA
MGDFHKEPSQEGDECDNMALKMWLSWTKTTTDITIYPISEYFRQKFKVDKKFQYYSTLKLKNISNLLVYGRGFGIDDANCRQSAAHSFFQHLHENQLVPNNFLTVVQEEKLGTNVEIKAACINRWNLFTELLNQQDTVIMVDDVEIVEQTPSPVKPIETIQMNIKESPSYFLPVEVEHVIIKESPSKPIEPQPIVIEESPYPTKPLQNGHNKDDSDSDDAS